MTRFKVDDQVHSHPKVMATDPAALGLWVVAGSWCCAGLTDGFVPDYALTRLLPGAAKLASKLVAAGLWIKVQGGYQFHDWQQFNLSAEQEKKRKADNAKRQAEWRVKANASRNASRNGASDDALSNPTPLLSGERGVGRRPRSRDAAPPIHIVPDWCGDCGESNRMLEDEHGRLFHCPSCHPGRSTA